MKFEVIVTEVLGKVVEVEADREDQALEMVDAGDWDDEQVVRSELVSRQVEGVVK